MNDQKGSEDLRKQKIEVLLEKFKSFKMLPGELFDMLDERFYKILNDLASLNHVLSPKEKNVRLLRSLRAEWYTKATAMEEGRNLENYTVQGLLDELRTYEHELKKKKEEQVTPFPTALMTTPRVPASEGTCPRNCDTPSSRQPSKTENYDEEFAMMIKQFRKFKKFFKKADSVRRPSKGKPQVSDSPPESYLCYNCRKPGHWKSACPYPKVEKYGERERNEKKKAMVAAESDESSSSSSDEEALVCMERRAEKSNQEDRWTMSEDDTLCLIAKDDADQEVTSQTSCSSSYESIPTSENLFDKFKKIMEDFEEINLKHTSLSEENKLLSEENFKLTEGRKSQLSEITQIKAENESLSEKVKFLNKELGILKFKEAVDKLLETTKRKGCEGLGFDPSNSKRKGRTTFIPPKPIAKPNKQKGKEKEKLTEVPKKFCDKGYSLEFCKDMASLKNISTNEVILTGKRIRNIYEVMWDDVKEACLISKVDKPSKHKVLDLSDKDEEINEGNGMKPMEFIPFGSLPLKTSQRNPDSVKPTGNHGQPSNIPDHSHDDHSGNGDQEPIHPETPTNSKLEAKCSSPAFYQTYLEVIAAQELSEFLHLEIGFKYEEEVLEFYKNGKVSTIQSKKNPQRTIQVIKSTVGGTKTIGISGQIPSGPAKKADLENDYKLVLELVIACLECGSGGHADDITQERAFIINTLITRTKARSMMPDIGSTAEDEGSSDNVLIVSLKKSSKRKQMVSPSPSHEEPHTLALVNLDEEEEVLLQGELLKKKKRRVFSPSTSGNANPDDLVQNEPIEEVSAREQSRQQFVTPQDQSLPSSPSQAQTDDEVSKFMQLYYDWRAWKTVLTTEAQADMEAGAEDFHVFLETSPASDTVLPEAVQENAAIPQQEQIQTASEEELLQSLQFQVQEFLSTPFEISNTIEPETSEKSKENQEESPLPDTTEEETDEESMKTLKINEEEAEQGDDAQSLSATLL
ncbi:unnamed protein product [Cuscuta campestris]|uniref:CCHC-type domain-containing protein n=1 Tax=Cuscuta campestris TaxID=132261 RepID=A0A484K9K1_9ASTE|nr:unnamed protein product [Cuscuta campestris]